MITVNWGKVLMPVFGVILAAGGFFGVKHYFNQQGALEATVQMYEQSYKREVKARLLSDKASEDLRLRERRARMKTNELRKQVDSLVGACLSDPVGADADKLLTLLTESGSFDSLPEAAKRLITGEVASEVGGGGNVERRPSFIDRIRQRFGGQ